MTAPAVWQLAALLYGTAFGTLFLCWLAFVVCGWIAQRNEARHAD